MKGHKGGGGTNYNINILKIRILFTLFVQSTSVISDPQRCPRKAPYN